MATTEERLAALETKLAALTATTPTTYYTHQYSGEEIDAAVGRAVTGGALDTSVTNVSNQLGTFTRPNLLDNWYFGNPINQRGQTEYTGNVYYIDRWRSWDGDSVSLSVVSGGIKIAGTLYQYFESAFFEELWGKTVAISLLLSDGTLYTDYFALKRADWYTVPIKAHGLDSVQFGINNNNFGDQNNNFFRVQPTTIGTLSDTILAVKLELGSNQTLAHREGDRWVLNEVPDYGEQLRRCQRYFVRVGPGGNSPAGIGIYRDGNINGWLPLPVEMRTVPSLSFNGSLFTVPSFHYVNFKNQDASTTRIVMYLCELINSGETFPKVPYSLHCGTDSYIDISADL